MGRFTAKVSQPSGVYETLSDRQTDTFLGGEWTCPSFSSAKKETTCYLFGPHISPNETSRICPWDAAASTVPCVKPDFEKAYNHEPA